MNDLDFLTLRSRGRSAVERETNSLSPRERLVHNPKSSLWKNVSGEAEVRNSRSLVSGSVHSNGVSEMGDSIHEQL